MNMRETTMFLQLLSIQLASPMSQTSIRSYSRLSPDATLHVPRSVGLTLHVRRFSSELITRKTCHPEPHASRVTWGLTSTSRVHVRPRRARDEITQTVTVVSRVQEYSATQSTPRTHAARRHHSSQNSHSPIEGCGVREKVDPPPVGGRVGHKVCAGDRLALL
jgi:hypothetical protein